MRVGHHSELLSMSELDDAERFQEADRLVRRHFVRLVGEGHIAGAFPFGSTQFNDQNPFSDYDIAVAIHEAGVEAETESFQAIHDAARDIYRQTAVPLEVSCFTDQQLINGMHGLPSSMFKWLQGQRLTYPESVIGADFLPHTQPMIVRQSPSTFTAVDTYIASTRHLLKKVWGQGEYFRPHDLLGVVLSAPHMSVRKIIDAMQSSGIIAADSMPDVRKSSIATAVLATFSDDGQLCDLYTAIAGDAERYQEAFPAEAAQLTADEYDQIVVATLEDNLPKSIELLRRLQEAYRRQCNEAGIYYNMDFYVERGGNETYGQWHSRAVDAMRNRQMESY